MPAAVSQPPPHGYPPLDQQPPPRPSGGTSALVIVAAILVPVVLIVGVLAVLALSGMRRYLAAAKAAEAGMHVTQISVLAEQAYTRDGALCPSATAPVPSKVPRGTKYQSSASDWETDRAASAGFSCLGFAMSQPQYFQYRYEATPTGFTATAHGDLNGDGVVSTFEKKGSIAGGALKVAGITEIDPDE